MLLWPALVSAAGQKPPEVARKKPAPAAVALVIGNGMLNGDLRLPGAPGAACLVAKQLRRLGIATTTLENPSRATLRKAIRAFAARAHKADVALIYHAGYSYNRRGRNRVIPADGALNSPRRLLRTSLPLDGMAAALRQARQYGLLLFDGGHDLPALKTLQKRTRNRIRPGLARLRPPPGVLALLPAPPGTIRPADDEEAGRMAIALAQTLTETHQPLPLMEFLRAIATRLAPSATDAEALVAAPARNRKRRGGKRGGEKKRALVWPFVTAPEKPEGGLVFSWEKDERDPEKIYERCRKLAVLRALRLKAARACKRTLALSRRRADRLQRYRDLVERYPHAPCVEELKKRIARLREERAWKRLAKTRSIAAFRRFLKRFPQGAHAKEAHQRLEGLLEERRRRERKAFAAARAESAPARQITALERFIEDFPDGAHVEEARVLLAKVKKRERERRAFEQARRQGEPEALEAFIRTHPGSEFVEKARRAIRAIIFHRQRVAFERAKKSGDIARLKEFVRSDPDPLLRAMAKAEIRFIRWQRLRERHLWRQAREKGSLRAYRDYLAAFPKGPRAEEARKEVARLERLARRRKAEKRCRERFGEDFISLVGDEEPEFVCVTKGKVAQRFIPLAADRVGEWYFVKRPSGLCEIWTYPQNVSGTVKADAEPEVTFWERAGQSGASMGFGVTRSNLWQADETPSMEMSGQTYTLSRWSNWIKPRKTGDNSISDEVTKALAEGGDFVIHGVSNTGEPVRMEFSADGFAVQFRDMANTCGSAILTWIEDWGAVVRSGSAFYWGSEYGSERTARRRILQHCRNDGGYGCREVTTFRNACFALFRAMSGGWAWATRATIDQATNAARQECEFRHEGCYLSITFCADGSHNYNNTNPPKPSLTWVFSSSTPYSVSLEFYSQSRNAAWPGGNKVWVLDDYEKHTYRLGCVWGEKICWGAWSRGNSNHYWGCGYGCRQYCPDCCALCKGQTMRPIRLND